MKKPFNVLHLHDEDLVEIIPHPHNCIVTTHYIGKQGVIKRFAGDYTNVVVTIGDKDVYCVPQELKRV